MGTYVVGDIHGCFDEWIELKNRIESQDSEAKFILVGDIVDRGPKVMEMIEWAMQNITVDGKYQMVIGNHEVEKIEWWRKYILHKDGLQYRIENANDIQCSYVDFYEDRYDFKYTMEDHGKTDEEVSEIIKFFESLPYYKELYVDTGRPDGKQHYLVAHAYIPRSCLDDNEAFDESSIKIEENDSIGLRLAKLKFKEKIIWERIYGGYRNLKNTIVIHGHTPTVIDCFEGYGVTPGAAYFRRCDINVDCGITYEMAADRNLCAIRLEDLQEFYLRNYCYTYNEFQIEQKNAMVQLIKTGSLAESEIEEEFNPDATIALFEKLLEEQEDIFGDWEDEEENQD